MLTLATQNVEAVVGHWAAAADKSTDLLVCHGGLDSTPADAQFAEEALRVLRPGGHAVLLLRDTSDCAAAWRALLDSFERPSTASPADAAPRHRWRLVHKTAPLPHPEGGTCRVYVFRARTLRSLHGMKGAAAVATPQSPVAASPPSSPPSTSPPPTEVAEPTPDGVHQLFTYTSDYYVAMQGALETGMESLLARMREDAAQSKGAVCRTALAPEVRSTVTDDARFPTRYVSFPAALAPEMLKVQDTIAICPSIASQKVGRSRRPVAGARTRADRCSLPTKGRPRRPRRRPRLGVAARCGARGAEGARPRRPRAARRWRGAGRLRRPLPRGAATFSRADSHELSVK